MASIAGHRRRLTRLYLGGGGWGGWRRGVDFYNEGTLIWLEADVTIRRLTKGKKTLDDFCTLFHGQSDNGHVWVKPYDADGVYPHAEHRRPVRLEGIL